MQDPRVVIWICLGATALLTFWCLLVTIIGLATGWRALARRYTDNRQPSGKAFAWRSLLMGRGGRYGGCITARFSARGVRLVPFWLFRLGHPPLILPWSCVKGPEERRQFGRTTVWLRLEPDGRVLLLDLPPAGWQWLEQHRPPTPPAHAGKR